MYYTIVSGSPMYSIGINSSYCVPKWIGTNRIASSTKDWLNIF